MRALVVHEFGPLESHRIEDVPTPKIGDHDVLISVKAIGLNYPDTLMLQGKYQTRPDRPFVHQNRAGMRLQQRAHRGRDPRAEIALALRQHPEGARQQHAQRRFAADRRIDRIAGGNAIPREPVDGAGEVADEAGRERGALLRPQRRGEARLGEPRRRGLAENSDRDSLGHSRHPQAGVIEHPGRLRNRCPARSANLLR